MSFLQSKALMSGSSWHALTIVNGEGFKFTWMALSTTFLYGSQPIYLEKGSSLREESVMAATTGIIIGPIAEATCCFLTILSTGADYATVLVIYF